MTPLDRLSGRRAYFDANVFIYAVNAFPPFAAIIARLFDAVDQGRLSAVTSELTLAELLVKPSETPTQRRRPHAVTCSRAVRTSRSCR